MDRHRRAGRSSPMALPQAPHRRSTRLLQRPAAPSTRLRTGRPSSSERRCARSPAGGVGSIRRTGRAGRMGARRAPCWRRSPRPSPPTRPSSGSRSSRRSTATPRENLKEAAIDWRASPGDPEGEVDRVEDVFRSERGQWGQVVKSAAPAPPAPPVAPNGPVRHPVKFRCRGAPARSDSRRRPVPRRGRAAEPAPRRRRRPPAPTAARPRGTVAPPPPTRARTPPAPRWPASRARPRLQATARSVCTQTSASKYSARSRRPIPTPSTTTSGHPAGTVTAPGRARASHGGGR